MHVYSIEGFTTITSTIQLTTNTPPTTNNDNVCLQMYIHVEKNTIIAHGRTNGHNYTKAKTYCYGTCIHLYM